MGVYGTDDPKCITTVLYTPQCLEGTLCNALTVCIYGGGNRFALSNEAGV